MTCLQRIKNFIEANDKATIIIAILLFIWVAFYIVQAFLAFGTAYRCAKKGADNGLALFIYLIGFQLAAFVHGLGLHHYIKHLPPRVVIRQVIQQQAFQNNDYQNKQ